MNRTAPLIIHKHNMIVEKNSLPKLINDVESNNTFDENLFRKNVGYGDF